MYRLLRPDEPYLEGLYPKDVNSKTSIREHIELGNQGKYQSRFISCCKTMKAIERMVEKHCSDLAYRHVVRINISKLNPKDVTIIDLTVKETVAQHLAGGFKAQTFSRFYEEVILEPKTCIPGECVEKIKTVRDHQFV